MLSLADRLAAVPDPRGDGGKRYPLAAILNLMAVAILCGLRSLGAIAQFGRELPAGLAAEVGFRRDCKRRPGRKQTPCKAALSKLLRRLDLAAVETQLAGWAGDRVGRPAHLALDGKTLRGTKGGPDGDTPAVHLLALYAVEARAVVAQAPVDAKTNEHKAALAMLHGRDLAGATVTADGMFTHRDFCQAVLDAGGHYVLPVEENQPTLRRDIQAAFAPLPEGLSPPAARAP